MPRRSMAVGCTAVVAALASLALVPPADAARRCGIVGRPFTDGGAAVRIDRGARLRCATARGLMRRYWSTSIGAFTRRVVLRHAGVRWTCRPLTDDFPYRWACRGGGRRGDRFRVTARE